MTEEECKCYVNGECICYAMGACDCDECDCEDCKEGMAMELAMQEACACGGNCGCGASE